MPDVSGQRSEFSRLYLATLTPLRHYLARMLSSEADAHDVAHDAYVRVYAAMSEKHIAHPRALLYTVARHLALNRLKRRNAGPIDGGNEGVVETVASPSPGIERLVMAREEWGRFRAAILTLPRGCQNVLVLCRVENLSHDEVAARLGISRSTVEKQLARGLRILRETMQPAGAGQVQKNKADSPPVGMNTTAFDVI
jgi:RNA polymerase sigma factor (sigma-70 family)